MASSLLTTSAADLEGGVFVQASRNGAIVSVLGVNHKYRKDHVAVVVITLAGDLAGMTPIAYKVIDAFHSSYYDQGSGAGTLEDVTLPLVVGGTVSLTTQPRSVHLLQLATPAPIFTQRFAYGEPTANTFGRPTLGEN